MKNSISFLFSTLFLCFLAVGTLQAQSSELVKFKVTPKLTAATLASAKWASVNAVEAIGEGGYAVRYTNGKMKTLPLSHPLGALGQQQMEGLLVEVYELASGLTVDDLTENGLSPDMEEIVDNLAHGYTDSYIEPEMLLNIIRLDHVVIEMIDMDIAAYMRDAVQGMFENSAVFSDFSCYVEQNQAYSWVYCENEDGSQGSSTTHF